MYDILNFITFPLRNFHLHMNDHHAHHNLPRQDYLVIDNPFMIILFKTMLSMILLFMIIIIMIILILSMIILSMILLFMIILILYMIISDISLRSRLTLTAQSPSPA